ncbi:MAG: helix-turn-helix domain-containing protein [Proteobacteria bacterium]|nr:helix-turn-helix domain-containing protein [Pseudomonadota bacterium]
MTRSMGLTRGKLAAATGCHIETIRYYEKIALLPQPKRAANGYRIYGGDDIKRLGFIRKLRALGFTLDETRGLLTLVDGHDYTCGDVRAIAVAHIDNIRAKIDDLRKMETTLGEMANACSGGDVPDCPIIDDLYSGPGGPGDTA